MRNLQITKFNKTKGFTIIELLVVGVILATLYLTISTYSNSGNDDAISNEEERQTEKVNDCIRSSRVGATFAGLDTQTLIDTGCLNDLGLLNEDRDAIINAVGGAITIEPTAFNGIDDLAVEVTSTGYESKLCVASAQHKIRIAKVVSIDDEETKAQGQEVVAIDTITDNCDSEDLIEISWVVTR